MHPLAIGLPLHLLGVIHVSGGIVLNLVAALGVVVPVVFAAAALESLPRGTTPGRRALHLHVRSDGHPLGFGGALVRNSLKIGLPWLLGHAAVLAIVLTTRAGQPTPVWVWALTAAAYVLPVAYIVSLFTGRGRTPCDRITGGEVTASLTNG